MSQSVRIFLREPLPGEPEGEPRETPWPDEERREERGEPAGDPREEPWPDIPLGEPPGEPRETPWEQD